MLTCGNCGRESPDDFAFCPACASPLAPPAAQHETRRTVTVVFCDVTGSTAMGERLDPESLRRIMSRYFEEMRAALERHGGTVARPAPQQDCPANFGNSDIYGGTYADPTP